MTQKKVAIVIPCRNEEHYIERCLLSLLQQSYPISQISIIVVDGFSTDKTREKIIQLQHRYSQILLLNNSNKTTPYALNLGICYASDADYIMILGAHAELEKDYIVKAVELLNNNDAIACVGGVLLNISENSTTEVISAAMSSVFGVGSAHFRTGLNEGFVDTVAFGMYRRQVFDAVGLFDEELIRNQDDEFNFRLIKSGFRIFLSRQLRARYYVRTSWKKLIRQFYQYGYWKVYVNRKHRTITTVRQLVPFMFVLYLLLLFCCLIFLPQFWYLAIMPLNLYLLIAFIISFGYYTNIADNIRLIITFLLMHVSYGWGYAVGIFDFYILNKSMQKTDEKLSR